MVICAFVMLPFTARAYTVDEIIDNSEWMICTYRYFNWEGDDHFNGYSPKTSETIRLEKLNDHQIIFHGIRGSLDFVFDLVDYSGNTTADGYQLEIPGNRICTNGTTADGVSGWCLVPTVKRKLTFDFHPEKHWILNIKTNNDGKLYFLEDGPSDAWGMMPYYAGKDYLNFWAEIIQWARFDPFNGTSVARDEYSHWDDFDGTAVCKQTINREYPVNVKFDFISNTFEIENFSNLGYAWEDSNAYYDNIGSDITWSNSTNIKGKLVPDENKILFDLNQISRFRFLHQTIYLEYIGMYDHTWGWYPFKLARFTFNPALLTGNVTGTYYLPEEDKPVHNTLTVDHHWVTNHGKRRTYNGTTIEIEPYTYGISDLSTLFPDKPNFIDSYNNTTITNGDCTLDVDLVIDNFEFNKNNGQGRLQAHIITNRNDRYVNHYSIFVVKGTKKYIDQDDFKLDENTGHEGALLLVDGEVQNTRAQINKIMQTQTEANGLNVPFRTHDYAMDVLLPKDKLDEQFDSKGEYTFFIRATYNDPELHPTFHSLSFATPNLPTNIDNIAIDDSLPTSPVYYNLSGVRMSQGQSLLPGVYVKVTGNRVEKIIIR